MKSAILLVFALFYAVFATANEPSQRLKQAGITQTTLENGLKVIVKTDTRSPIFVSQLWYRVGASDESRPITGISHMLEHMMFKGTKTYGAGEFSKIIDRNGGTNNAFTSNDVTTYHQTMHNSKLELAIKLEADRMRHLNLSEQHFEKERQVVIEERRMRIDDKPNSQVYEQLRQISFDEKRAYHAPIIGFAKDIAHFKLADLQRWYQQYYAPNNATLVVVGDVNPQHVIQLAKQYFGNYQRNPRIGRYPPRDSIARTGRSKILKLKAKLPFYALSFHAPSLKTATNTHNVYSLEMLAYVLDNQLTKSLVLQRHIVSSISLGYHLYNKYDTLFTLAFVSARQSNNQAVLKAIKQQIADWIQNPKSIQDQLKRTKTQLEASFVYEQDLISTQANSLGTLSSAGLEIQQMLDYVKKMQAITVEDVANAAQKYLNFERANYVELQPQTLQ